MRGSIVLPGTLLFEHPVYSPDQGDSVKYVSGPPPSPHTPCVTGLLLEVICDLIGQWPQLPTESCSPLDCQAEKSVKEWSVSVSVWGQRKSKN